MAQIFPNLAKDVSLTDSRSWLNPKWDKPKEICTKIYHNQISENCGQRKKIKAERAKRHFYLYENLFKSQICHGCQKEMTTFQMLKEKICQHQILYLAILSFKNEGAIKVFSKEGKLGEGDTNRLITPKEWLKEVLEYSYS